MVFPEPADLAGKTSGGSTPEGSDEEPETLRDRLDACLGSNDLEAGACPCAGRGLRSAWQGTMLQHTISKPQPTRLLCDRGDSAPACSQWER